MEYRQYCTTVLKVEAILKIAAHTVAKISKDEKFKQRKKIIFNNFYQVRVLNKSCSNFDNFLYALRSFEYLHFNEFATITNTFKGTIYLTNPKTSSRVIPQTQLPTLKSISLSSILHLQYFLHFPFRSSVQGLATSRVDSFSESTFITLIFIPCLRPRTTCWR